MKDFVTAFNHYINGIGEKVQSYGDGWKIVWKSDDDAAYVLIEMLYIPEGVRELLKTTAKKITVSMSGSRPFIMGPPGVYYRGSYTYRLEKSNATIAFTGGYNVKGCTRCETAIAIYDYEHEHVIPCDYFAVTWKK